MITYFGKQHRFLSNFYQHKQWWDKGPMIGGVWVDTVEHAFQASKTLDRRESMRIATAGSPGIAKQLGRTCTLRADWDTVKLQVMRELLAEKFKDGPLRQLLMQTGTTPLIEGNNWGDTTWGQDPLGVGTNYLGKLLMEIRGDGPRVELEP